MKWTRRDIIKGLGGLPIAGAIWWAGAASSVQSSKERSKLLEQLNIEASLSKVLPPIGGAPVRVGIIGFGIRGEQLCRSLGFATRDWLNNMEKAAEENPNHSALSDFNSQEKLNVNLVAVCDVFDVRAQEVIDSFSTEEQAVKRFRTYQEMIRSGDVEAIIIATPDHWHAPMAIDALENNVHVYIEKPMTHTIEETYRLREAAQKSKARLMVGHQHRQTLSFQTAKDVVTKNTLGHISMVQTNTNRNDDNGAWNYDIDKDANEQTIDWEQFLGSGP